jgi:hypothetical protein
MLLLFVSMALTNTQQAQHDRTELAIYRRMQAEQAVIADMWRPDARLLADYHKAQKCYVHFHLYRVKDCQAALTRVDRDLGEVETAQAGER